MNAEENILEWKRLAEMDLSVATLLFEMHRPIPLEAICFHSQQAAEKMLKCFLVANSIAPPKTHNLNKLLEMCSAIEKSFDNLEKEANILTDYAVFPRYPADIELDEGDAKAAIKFANKISDYVSKLLFHNTQDEAPNKNLAE